jgi:hypothetical protein
MTYTKVHSYNTNYGLTTCEGSTFTRVTRNIRKIGRNRALERRETKLANWEVTLQTKGLLQNSSQKLVNQRYHPQFMVPWAPYFIHSIKQT